MIFNQLLQWVSNAQTGFGPYWGHRQCDAAYPTTRRLMILHFAEVVHLGVAAAQWVAAGQWERLKHDDYASSSFVARCFCECVTETRMLLDQSASELHNHSWLLRL